MRVYPGIPAHTLPPANSAEFTPRLREMLTTLDIWARDASHAFARLSAGQTPDASGTSLSGGGGGVSSHHALTHLTDFDDHPQYLYLAGRAGGQTVSNIATGDVLLTLSAFAGQTAHIQEWNVSGTLKAYVVSDGSIVSYSGATAYSYLAAASGFNHTTATSVMTASVSGLSATYPTGSGANRFTIAATNNYFGISINSQSQFLYIGRGNGASVQTPASSFYFAGGVTSDVTLSVSAGATSTGDLQQWLVGTTKKASVDINGAALFTGATISPATDISSLVSTHTAIGTVQPFIKLTQTAGDASAGSNFIECYSFSGTKVAYVDPAGNITGNLSVLDSATGNTLALQPLTGFSVVGNAASFVDGTGTVVIDNNSYTGSFNVNLGLTTRLISNTASGGASFSDTTTASKRLRFVMSGAATSGNNIVVAASASTGTARAYTLGEQGGRIVVAGNGTASAVLLGAVSSTGLVANLGATNLVLGSTGSAGLYRVSVYMTVTAAAAGATITANIAWNDGAAQTNNTILIAAATLNAYAQGTAVCYLAASQNLTVAATLGGAGTPTYSVWARVEALG